MGLVGQEGEAGGARGEIEGGSKRQHLLTLVYVSISNSTVQVGIQTFAHAIDAVRTVSTVAAGSDDMPMLLLCPAAQRSGCPHAKQ